jgi:hypothetical protein
MLTGFIMKSKHNLPTFFLAICALAIGAPAANAADTLIEYEKASMLEGAGTHQVLSKVVVGPNDVTIGGFGVYGKAQASGNIKFILFDAGPAPTQPRFISSAQAVQASSTVRWYDLADPSFLYTLKAGHTYGMGLISDRANGPSNFQFAAGYNSGFGGDPKTSTIANGLTVPFTQWLTLNAVTGCSAGLCTFGANPTLFQDNTTTYKPSLHIFAPVPEPAEWAMLIAGLMVVGFIARRRNGMLG